MEEDSILFSMTWRETEDGSNAFQHTENAMRVKSNSNDWRI